MITADVPLRDDAPVVVIISSSSWLWPTGLPLKTVFFGVSDLRRGLRMAAGRFTLPGGMVFRVTEIFFTIYQLMYSVCTFRSTL